MPDGLASAGGMRLRTMSVERLKSSAGMCRTQGQSSEDVQMKGLTMSTVASTNGAFGKVCLGKMPGIC